MAMKARSLIIAWVLCVGFVAHRGYAESAKLWSILICTLEERKNMFDHIYNKLMGQIRTLGLENEIEVLYFCDNRTYSVGYKRNILMQESAGDYVNYVDDDDDVHDNYIQMIYEKLLKSPDCVSLVGIITVNHAKPKVFIHSIKYDRYFSKDNIYYRPPNHLNPIRRTIAAQFVFPEKNFGEDTDWAMQIARSGLIKTEEEITEPYYFYDYIPNKPKT